MTTQQTDVTGYRQLSAEEVGLMNEIKALGVQAGALVERLRKMNGGDASLSLDQRWISIGATEMQLGLMALTRGVAQPTTF